MLAFIDTHYTASYNDPYVNGSVQQKNVYLSYFNKTVATSSKTDIYTEQNRHTATYPLFESTFELNTGLINKDISSSLVLRFNHWLLNGYIYSTRQNATLKFPANDDPNKQSHGYVFILKNGMINDIIPVDYDSHYNEYHFEYNGSNYQSFTTIKQGTQTFVDHGNTIEYFYSSSDNITLTASYSYLNEVLYENNRTEIPEGNNAYITGNIYDYEDED